MNSIERIVFFFSGNYNFRKYKGRLTPVPLHTRPERQFCHRIANKLNDTQIHALFLTEFFYEPDAFISSLVGLNIFRRAVAFDARRENGETKFDHDLYELRKTLQDVDLDTWLYGEFVGPQRSAIPPCLQDVIERKIPLDIACLLFLIPQPDLGFDWKRFHLQHVNDFGPAPWILRLRKVDQLLQQQRGDWRSMTHRLAKTFWTSLDCPSLAPVAPVRSTSLFEEV